MHRHFFAMDKTSIPHIEWCIGKCPGLCTIFFKNWHIVVAGTKPKYLKWILNHAVIYIFLKYFGLQCSFLFLFPTLLRVL